MALGEGFEPSSAQHTGLAIQRPIASHLFTVDASRLGYPSMIIRFENNLLINILTISSTIITIYPEY